VLIEGCAAGTPKVQPAPDGTPCDTSATCKSGVCTKAQPDNQAGCSDGTREGFKSLGLYPNIAACSGGWSVPGITRADLTQTCGGSSGNSATNKEGQGCSAADLCSGGWHVCRGKEEVASRSTTGCAGAYEGASDKSLFFAVVQASNNGSICEAGAGNNDIFGCGNLGATLDGSKQCAPLNKVIASTSPGNCGYNEAEPNLGPWECHGGTDSHYHEGQIVTKKGCSNSSCTTDGHSVATWDKGGVLCCRD
jgi:hypothetical protein